MQFSGIVSKHHDAHAAPATGVYVGSFTFCCPSTDVRRHPGQARGQTIIAHTMTGVGVGVVIPQGLELSLFCTTSIMAVSLADTG